MPAPTSLITMRPTPSFAEPGDPPTPVVLLLAHTDLPKPPRQGLLMHEDLEDFVGSGPRPTVSFALPASADPTLPPVDSTLPAHTYPPPPPIMPDFKPKPSNMHGAIEDWTGWEAREAKQIKERIEFLANALLDTTKSWSEQDQSNLETVHKMFHLKKTKAAHAKAQSAVATAVATRALESLPQRSSPRTRSKAQRANRLHLAHALCCFKRCTCEASKTIGMDLDPSSSNETARPQRKRTANEHTPDKYRAISNPQRGELDSARQAVREAQHANLSLAAEADAARAALAAAQAANIEQTNRLLAMQAELIEKSRAIADMQHHEGQMEAQFISDQGKLDTLFQQYSGIFQQINDAQQLLMERNAEINRLQDTLALKTDEIAQLRANNRIQAQKTPQKHATPRRSKRLNMSPLANSGVRTIEIPLDPIPMAEAPEPAPSTSRPIISASPALAELLNSDVDTLDDMLSRFQQLCVGGKTVVDVVRGKPQKGGAAKKGSGSAELKKDKSINALINFAHRRLRHFTCMNYNVTFVYELYLHTPAPEALVSATEAGVDPPADLFQWDYSSGYLTSRFNRLMIEKIVDKVLEDEEDAEVFASVGADREFLTNAMKDKLKDWRGGWNKFQPKYQPAAGRIETKAEAHARALQKLNQHQLEMRSLASKDRKLDDRRETAALTIEVKIAEGTALDIKRWERIADVIQRLGVAGMSSEEEADVTVDGGKVRLYKIKLCLWREPSIANILGFVDAQTLLRKANQPGPKPAPRVRNAGHGPGVAPAPRGLPRSLYNNEWLKGQTPAFVETLQISKEAFELFVAATDRMNL
ncbi:hypothetical protein R3P38DRAFT_3291134 [Favolaschia claudopus]|uniref:Uncharacterized protein n=1 Tax=Favolaschia claudopus TaxID=2862362 RepID=A0AAV9ZPD6_9AGAR